MDILMAIIAGAVAALILKSKMKKVELDKEQEKSKELEQELNSIQDRIKQTEEHHDNLENPSDIVDFWNNRKR